MEKFNIIFNKFISKKVGTQIEQIEKICSDFDIDASIWFNNDFKRNYGCYTGTDFLKEMLPHFVYYLSGEFEKLILKYVEPSGYNCYKEPYLGLDMELEYCDGEFVVFNNKKEYKKSFKNVIKKLTLTQKEELMKNKLFCAIVNQTNLKIYSKSDIRVLKLKNLNEYSGNITE